MPLQPSIQFLATFNDAEDERQLAELDNALQILGSSDDGVRAAVPALLGIFERFPTSDGFGVFWRILHALESVRGSYEVELVSSLRRAPSEFGVMMVDRCLTAGERHAGGTDLAQLLVDVANRPDAITRVRELASECALRHEAG